MADCASQQREYWDSRYRDEAMLWGDRPSATAHQALRLFRREGARSVLVPGSGYGRNTRLFSASGLDVVGVEISPVAVDLAKRHDPSTRFHSGSILDAEISGAPFDAIYCFNLLHLFRRDDRLLVIRRFRDLLRDGGTVFLTVFSEAEPTFGKGREVEENTFESKPGRPVHYFTEADLLNHLSGFEIIETGLAEEHEDHG